MEKFDNDKFLKAYCEYTVNTTDDVKWYEIAIPVIILIGVVIGYSVILYNGL